MCTGYVSVMALPLSLSEPPSPPRFMRGSLALESRRDHSGFFAFSRTKHTATGRLRFSKGCLPFAMELKIPRSNRNTFFPAFLPTLDTHQGRDLLRPVAEPRPSHPFRPRVPPVPTQPHSPCPRTRSPEHVPVFSPPPFRWKTVRGHMGRCNGFFFWCGHFSPILFMF